MGQFPPGIPYVAGQRIGYGAGGPERQQALTRLVNQATAHTRYDGVVGQAVVFGPIKGSSNLLFCRVIGPFGSQAFLYVGQGNQDALVQAPNLESTSTTGHQDEGSWARPGIPIYDQWSVAIFWDRPTSWGIAVGKIYYEAVTQ